MTPDQLRVADQLRETCINVGFFFVKDHGCSLDVQQDALQQCRKLFASEIKNDYPAHKSPLWRGYNSTDSSSHSCTPDDRGKDYKESFTIGAEGDASPMHGANPWPTPEFEKGMRDYWKSLLETVAPRLCQALALSLGKPKDFFLQYIQDPVAQMVLLYYPKRRSIEDARGCGAHTDCGFLTILLQDQPGLQIQNKDNTWVDAPCIPNTFIVNLGDMTERWSNDLYKSTTHRVKSSSQVDRYSIPFFLNCDFDTKVECLCEKGEEPKYPPTIAGHYILEKLGLMWMMDDAECE